MNDPQVKALYYWVNHDNSVDYKDADPLDYEHGLFRLQVSGRQVTIEPKEHHATEEEAVAAVEGFIRHWEFEAALKSGISRFSLNYMGVDLIDRNPPPSPPGVVQGRATFRSPPGTISARGTVVKKTYPQLPSGPTLSLDTPVVQMMLSQLDMYHRGMALLAPMAYFCLTALQDSGPKEDGRSTNAHRKKQVRDYYNISANVFDAVQRLSSYKGGLEARKGDAVSETFTKEERAFLVAAVQAFIRRAAERNANLDNPLPKITLADLPQY